MKRIQLEFTDAAYARLKTIIGIAEMAQSSSPSTFILCDIVAAIDRGDDVRTFKTRQERQGEPDADRD